MIRRASILLILVLMMTGAGSYPVQAEFFSNMGGSSPPPGSKEASASALRAIAKVIDAVADLEDGQTDEAQATLKDASGQLRAAAEGFRVLAQDKQAAAVTWDQQKLGQADLSFLGNAASMFKLQLVEGSTVGDLLTLTNAALEETASSVDRFASSPSQETYRAMRENVAGVLRLGDTVSLAIKQ